MGNGSLLHEGTLLHGGSLLHKDTFARRHFSTRETFEQRHFNPSLTVRVGLGLELGLMFRVKD